VSGYDLLRGITVIEVAQLGPDALGGLLADMGARVIKVESPTEGDPVRRMGALSVGDPHGFGFMHLRWNRGKESIGIDLRSADGAALFQRLTADADVVIDGLRGGALDRLGLGHAELSQANPRLVFCSLSGFGLDGAYHALGSHGPAYDAYGGLMRAAPGEKPGEGPSHYPIGMYAMGLQAAVGVLAAVIRARTTGEGAMVEVAAADVAAAWYTDTVDAALNPDRTTPRPGFADEGGRMFNWPRMGQYRTRDGRILFFQGYKDKFWAAFARTANRPDLLDIVPGDDVEAYHDRLMSTLTELFATRDRADWMTLLIEAGVPAHPLNTPEELAVDVHFVDRDLVYEARSPATGPLRLVGTPVKVHGQRFAPAIAPELGTASDRILAELGVDPAEAARLRAAGTIA
jgi:crotonobetainyl-CoA:carnitine CoA-transferase CaiB-like acyl-CoA transferase